MPGIVVHAFYLSNQDAKVMGNRAYLKKKSGGQGEEEGQGQDLERWLSWQSTYCIGIGTTFRFPEPVNKSGLW